MDANQVPTESQEIKLVRVNYTQTWANGMPAWYCPLCQKPTDSYVAIARGTDYVFLMCDGCTRKVHDLLREARFEDRTSIWP